MAGFPENRKHRTFITPHSNTLKRLSFRAPTSMLTILFESTSRMQARTDVLGRESTEKHENARRCVFLWLDIPPGRSYAA